MIFQSLISHKLYKTILLGGTFFAVAALTSCDLVKEDLEPCSNAELRFVYDYNMEFANAFPKQVDCLDVYFYNEDGKLVHTEKVTDESLLSDENYRMSVSLPEGNYHVVAYGGMGCEKSSFHHLNAPSVNNSSLGDLRVQLNSAALNDKTQARLHNHYFGSADFTLDYSKQELTVVEMMRNTNSVQIALQHMNGEPIDVNDFIFEITDDNNDFDFENNLIATGDITYIPWNTETRTTGLTENAAGDYNEYYAALAQFNTSRLYKTKATTTTLHVKTAKDGATVFKVPLVNYMLMFKNDRTGLNRNDMPDQEYLDRENSWNFVFFLDSDNLWVQSKIIVNNWVVRMNNSEF